MKTKIALSIGMLSLLVIMTAHAQEAKAPCYNAKISMITEEDYPNLMNITDLKKYSNVIFSGLSSNPNKLTEYRLTGNSRNTSIDAVYDKEGKLITAKLVKKDTPLPKAIYLKLIADSYKDWTIVSNKTFVKDFDAMSTEYEVKIKNGKKKQTLYFDSAGNQISRLAFN